MKDKPSLVVINHQKATRHAASYLGEVYGELEGHENLAMAYLELRDAAMQFANHVNGGKLKKILGIK